MDTENQFLVIIVTLRYHKYDNNIIDWEVSIIPWLEFVEICCIPSSLDNPCLFKLPIPTLKEGITIGDTMEAILVTQVGVAEEVFIDMLSSDVASTALVSLVFCEG